MREALERAVSLAVGVTAIVVAAVLIRREFAPGTARAQPTIRAESIRDWEEILISGRLIGDSKAPAKLIVFADLECPGCRAFHQIVRQVRKDYPSEVAVVFVHLPLPNHKFARPAARAAECARAQGRFWEFVDGVYEKQDSLGLKSFVSFAVDASVRDTLLFASCSNALVGLGAIENGIALAQRFGFYMTPTVMLNDWRFGAVPTKVELTRRIAKILDQHRAGL